ncbi:hypothetical protein [Methylopila sp. Yamaguchi]|uniref:hypothetical protein n=1 Tax=Methylopila sp. Yamaguchi TaxID=1437817 RepID=UPI000CBFCD10|nr:hypothetical protein [Methylopila sp. Yamaguchi]GBD48440.1 hypothetical protein METY_1653 [Methylopila sp. Yamaguchi]
MLQQTATDLALRLAAVYALVGVFVALTLIVALTMARIVKTPRVMRTGLYALYLLSIVALVTAYAAGALTPPGEAASRIAATAESAKAFDARNAAITPGDVAPAAATSAVVGTVYIQAPDMDARFAAEDLWRDLRAAGFQSPGIELVAGRAPTTPEVRYFNDADRPLAEQVAAIAAKRGLEGSVVKTIANYKAPPGQMEFWYPR